MWEKIKLSESYSILGDEEEVEDEADEAGQLSSATEKSKEDPVKKAITIKLDNPSGNSFVEFLGSISHPSGRSRRMRSKSHFGVASSGGALNGAGGYLRRDDRGRQLCTCTDNSHEKRFDSVLPVAGIADTEITKSKSGAANSAKGKRVTLRIEDREDLSRDILKPGTLSGRSTIVGGFSEQVYEELSEKVYTVGDSSTMVDEDRTSRRDTLFAQITNAEVPSTLLLNDPLANSYLQNLYLPDPDLNVEIVTSERKWQPNKELGLNDMKIENYIAEDVYEPKEGRRFEEVAS
ncbi:hypothetical protein PISMIDRAFT_12137 [Pisolithus microcarpus 441]|uniref:Zinc finger ZPR1-type domain-containing protein n=1 Tax=Pisolithus microcarpus 441 TaxID=765257 RepID=A0A0C9YXX5_9AGAM|nr:hypothetical protein PISMIDRAFT_12137 [Pisolithus microcarpus 441]